ALGRRAADARHRPGAGGAPPAAAARRALARPGAAPLARDLRRDPADQRRRRRGPAGRAERSARTGARGARLRPRDRPSGRRGTERGAGRRSARAEGLSRARSHAGRRRRLTRAAQVRPPGRLGHAATLRRPPASARGILLDSMAVTTAMWQPELEALPRESLEP